MIEKNEGDKQLIANRRWGQVGDTTTSGASTGKAVGRHRDKELTRPGQRWRIEHETVGQRTQAMERAPSVLPINEGLRVILPEGEAREHALQAALLWLLGRRLLVRCGGGAVVR